MCTVQYIIYYPEDLQDHKFAILAFLPFWNGLGRSSQCVDRHMMVTTPVWDVKFLEIRSTWTPPKIYKVQTEVSGSPFQTGFSTFPRSRVSTTTWQHSLSRAFQTAHDILRRYTLKQNLRQGLIQKINDLNSWAGLKEISTMACPPHQRGSGLGKKHTWTKWIQNASAVVNFSQYYVITYTYCIYLNSNTLF